MELSFASLLGQLVAVRTKCAWGWGIENNEEQSRLSVPLGRAGFRVRSPGLSLPPLGCSFSSCQKERLILMNYSLIHPTHSLLVEVGDTEIKDTSLLLWGPSARERDRNEADTMQAGSSRLEGGSGHSG